MTFPHEGEQPKNLVEQNVFLAGEIIGEKGRDLREKVEAIESLGVLYSPQEALIELSMLRMRTQESLEKLPQKQEEIESIIRRHRVETEIDEVFVRNLLTLTERQEERDDSFYQQESEVLSSFVSTLEDRKAKEQDEKSKEQEFDVEISQDRVFKFFLSENADKVRMELPLAIDPNKQNVKIGPEAVEQILGAKLTLEDYQKIAETLLSLRGRAGMICRAYAQAVDIFAELYTAHQDTSYAKTARMIRAQDIRNLFAQDDVRQLPFADIPLNALYIQIANEHKLIDSTKVPQPFEN